MEIVYTVFVFLFGLALASFFNVVGLRVPKSESIVKPRSHCPNCKRQLTAFELIPVLSYLFLGGKCRRCKSRISPIYPIIELVTGALFAASYWTIGYSAELVAALLFISLLSIITVSDIAYMIVPNKILLFFLPLIIASRLLSPLEVWWDSILGAVIGFSILLLIALVSKGGMGGGDIKLFFIIGLVLGTINTLMTLFLAALIGMFIGIVMLKIRNKGRKTPIPFVPFIAIAAITVYFFGNNIISWYFSLL